MIAVKMQPIIANAMCFLVFCLIAIPIIAARHTMVKTQPTIADVFSDINCGMWK